MLVNPSSQRCKRTLDQAATSEKKLLKGEVKTRKSLPKIHTEMAVEECPDDLHLINRKYFKVMIQKRVI